MAYVVLSLFFAIMLNNISAIVQSNVFMFLFSLAGIIVCIWYIAKE